MKRGCIAILGLVIVQFSCLSAAEYSSEPIIHSVFPLGGQIGQTFPIKLRGEYLNESYDLWFDSDFISATILGLETDSTSGNNKVQETKSGINSKLIQVLNVQLHVLRGATPGRHTLRVITTRGISNSLSFWIHTEPSYKETNTPHEVVTQSEQLDFFPIAVHGVLANPGEVDYYSFELLKSEALIFQVHSTALSDTALSLYEPIGSWFDPDRSHRIAFNDEPIFHPDLPTEPILEHHFKKSGKFIVRVSGFLGEGGPDHSYFLRIARASSHKNRDDLVPDNTIWEERLWTRPLQSNYIKKLQLRAVNLSSKQDLSKRGSSANIEGDLSAKIPSFYLRETDQEQSVPPVITLPVLLVGKIDVPGDIDQVRFSAKVGFGIAIEIETPNKTVPIFNPYIRVTDLQGEEVFTNVHSFLNANTEIQKQIKPKTIHSFPRSGEFTLEIRDITAVFGDSFMDYRVLIREQVPHMGKIHVEDDYLNLIPGRSTKLNVITDQEEGFSGSIALTLEGLPPGVRALTATESDSDKPLPVNDGKKDRYLAKSRKATFVLIVNKDVKPTRFPVKVRLLAQPVMNGRLGIETPVKELIVMVVASNEDNNLGANDSVESFR